MGIRVNPTKAVVALASYVEPGFNASWLEAKFSTSYLQAEATPSWLEVGVFAEVTFPDVYQVDVVTPTDLVTLAFTKSLADTTNGFAELTTRAFTKAAVDSVTMVDTVDIEYWIEKLLADTQSLADAITTALSKPLADTTDGFADVLSYGFTKALADSTNGFTDEATTSFDKAGADSLTLVDSVDIEYWIEKLLADSVAPSDATNLAVDKPFDDAATPADAFAQTFSKPLADVLAQPIDALSAVDVEKGLSESLTPSDLAVITLIFIRDENELLTSSDSSALDVFLNKSETLSPADDQISAVVKGLSENLNLIDNMDGDIEYDIIKLVGELLAASDGQVIDFATQSSDNVLTSSSGVLTMQDYCDITYFETDYVGESRTFT